MAVYQAKNLNGISEIVDELVEGGSQIADSVYPDYSQLKRSIKELKILVDDFNLRLFLTKEDVERIGLYAGAICYFSNSINRNKVGDHRIPYSRLCRLADSLRNHTDNHNGNKNNSR